MSLAVLSGGALPALQGGVTGGGVGALLVTLIVASVFYAVTLHLAATFFIGDVKSQSAAYVGPVPALVSILLGRWGVEGVWIISPQVGVLIVLLATLLADAMAISRVYKLAAKPTAALTLLHLAFSVVLAVALNNIFQFV